MNFMRDANEVARPVLALLDGPKSMIHTGVRTSMGTDKASSRGGPIRNIYFGREIMVL